MTIASPLQERFSATGTAVRFDEPMHLHTTLHIGGPAQVWAEPKDTGELLALLGIAREENLPVTAIGSGSNLLILDEGIPGLTLHLTHPGFQKIERKGSRLIAGAALPLERLVRQAEDWGLSGVECLAGIPGRLGGAIQMNAGTHDTQGNLHAISDIIQSVTVSDLQGRLRTLQKASVSFGYRRSDLINHIILEAELNLTPDNPQAIIERTRALQAFKKQTQDWSAPSAGCIFKNPADSSLSAGQMLDQAGLKGRQIGSAAFSQKHANFIMNRGSAQSADVLALIQEAQQRVQEKFGCELELEVHVVPKVGSLPEAHAMRKRSG